MVKNILIGLLLVVLVVLGWLSWQQFVESDQLKGAAKKVLDLRAENAELKKELESAKEDQRATKKLLTDLRQKLASVEKKLAAGMKVSNCESITGRFSIEEIRLVAKLEFRLGVADVSAIEVEAFLGQLRQEVSEIPDEEIAAVILMAKTDEKAFGGYSKERNASLGVDRADFAERLVSKKFPEKPISMRYEPASSLREVEVVILRLKKE